MDDDDNLQQNIEEFHQIYEQMLADMERDKFMSAQEALDYGLIDAIVTKRS